MTDLHPLTEGTVFPDQIDHLGHMNVHFYAARAAEATAVLAATHGLDARTCEAQGVTLFVAETFTRHYREQLEGAPLAVLGGVLEARPDALRLYHELRNRDSDEVSATFVHRALLCDRKRREQQPFPEGFLRSLRGFEVEWPERGQPRSVELGRLPTGLTLAEARARRLEMRAPRTLTAEECDVNGWFEGMRILDLFWAGEPVRPRAGAVPLLDAGDGRRFGWATLESRNVWLALPRVGTRIQSFSAEVGLARKTSFRHLWVFDVDRERLLAVASIVNLAFDIQARRAIAIPDAIRTQLQADHHPDLA